MRLVVCFCYVAAQTATATAPHPYRYRTTTTRARSRERACEKCETCLVCHSVVHYLEPTTIIQHHADTHTETDQHNTTYIQTHAIVLHTEKHRPQARHDDDDVVDICIVVFFTVCSCSWCRCCVAKVKPPRNKKQTYTRKRSI